jgi:hypothetical protein
MIRRHCAFIAGPVQITFWADGLEFQKCSEPGSAGIYTNGRTSLLHFTLSQDNDNKGTPRN